MTQSRPLITGTTHTLPFDKLSPRDFERLCLWLVKREGYERAEHLGAAGSEQGRDIVAWREGELWAFQCKRVQRFGPNDALAEAEKVLSLPQNERPVELVFLVTCDVSANTRQQVREHCSGQMECHFWTGTELDARVKRHADIVDEFFQADEGSTTIEAEGDHIAQATEGSMAIVGDANVIGDHSTAIKAEGEAVVATHGGVAAGQVAVGGDVHGNITVMVQGENVRDKELAYLNGLLVRYNYWLDHYTPLAGIAEVRAAVKDGPRLDLPMPFIPPGFEKLTEHGYGERAEIRREPVDDLRAAVAEHQRIILLGDPGSGKTTTLWRLAYDYAQAAKSDAQAPLPLLVPLGGYTDDVPFDAYLARYLGPLAPHLNTYHASSRLILLLDGLNEMPQAGYAERVGRIRTVIDRYPDGAVVVTCRALDYVDKLEKLQTVEVSPLDEIRIRDFLHNYLGETAGERLFWAIAGGGELGDLWDAWQRAGGTWEAFWTAEKMPENIYNKTNRDQNLLWADLLEEPPPLLVMGRNPYLLLMTAQVYVGAGGELPANRAKLFAAFVDTLLDREKKQHPQEWIAVERQKDGLAALAYAMQNERGRGTTVEREWALDRLIPLDCDAKRLLYLASSATLLDAGDSTVRFYHQLLQEYFAAREMGRRVTAGESLERYWPPDSWWEPAGWEETVILLAGIEPDASDLLEKLLLVNPVVAVRCLVESGAQTSDAVRQTIAKTLVARMVDDQQPPVARAQAGDALARLGDPRPGVGVDPATSLPDIVWCEVPAGPFLMGGSDDDEMTSGGEKPQHLNKTIIQSYRISRYPITNTQYAAFVEAGGYQERRYWTEAGWGWKEDEGQVGPDDYGEPHNLPNHTVVWVSWYEAAAFCRWLTKQLHQNGQIKADKEVSLPTEPQWEKAARGMGWRRYPWGNDPDPSRANYIRTGIKTTSAVGCFPGGVSPYGAEDLSGNVWEWTRSLFQSYPYQADDGREDMASSGRRVLRGGSFSSNQWGVRLAYRSRNRPRYRRADVGFRVCVVSRQN